MEDLVKDVLDGLCARLFDVPIMGNVERGMYVEQMILQILGSSWTYVGHDWAGWDLERADGVRVEIKQSARRQVWSKRAAAQMRYTIAPRAGYYTVDGEWIEKTGRHADVYIFASHAGFEPMREVDHRDPSQWTFHVVAERALPRRQRTIGLCAIELLDGAVRASCNGLTMALEDVVRGARPFKAHME